MLNNKNLKTLIVVFSILLFPHKLSGQLYRLSLDLGYQINSVPGKAFNMMEGIKTISLIKNFKSWQSPVLRISYDFNETSSAGVYFETSRLSDWKSSASDLYDNAIAKYKAAGLFYKYEPANIPWLGKFKAGASVGAMYGTYNILLTQLVYDLDFIQSSSFIPLDEAGNLSGVILDMTIGYPFSKNMKVYFNLGTKYLFLNSLLCTDRFIFTITPEVGFSFKLLKNKTYYIY